jgi:predicted transcriptional regulator
VIGGLSNRRSNIEVLADILRLGEAGKTELLYSANLSHRQLEKYLKFLLGEKLLEKIVAQKSVVKYRVTKRGEQLLSGIESVLESLWNFN